ncbi:MAG: aminomethyl-transferring glycine dehydrogenase subunit GcvPA [Candidatus Eremiobacteraeota bacterium]|nr:aminomethyl-transferring glycine dehydrogenase subunit GcvPA [Candidatus Eremiobacteraeota bacterium]
MYAPHTERDVEQMLQTIGIASLDELLRVPAEIALKQKLDVVPALPEYLIQRRFAHLAAQNQGVEYRSFLGAGSYRHYVPPAIAALAMRGEFLTAYTPYQAEVSQGYLQAIYEWQTYICLLTGMDLADASVYDGATALAEAAIMALGASGRRKVLVSRAIHPNYRAVLRTYCDGLDVEVDEVAFARGGVTDYRLAAEMLATKEYAAIAIQSPNFLGNVEEPSSDLTQAASASGTIPIGVVAEALALAALAPPAAWGAQIVAGEAQSFGVAMAYGGPYVGFIAATEEHMRRIPGRLVGKTVDNAGRTAYVLTLQAREQHIRRERATSNICTNQAHCALIATIYLALLGKTGLRDAAALNLARSRELASAVANVAGIRLPYDAPFFNEFVADVGRPARDVLAGLRANRILGGVDLGRFYPELDSCILMTATELTTTGDIAALAGALKEILRVPAHV